MNSMPDELSDRLARCYTAAVHDVMRSQGFNDFVLPPEIRSLLPDTVIAGPAFTFSGHVDPAITPHDTYLAWTGFLADAPAGSVAVCQPNDRTVAHMGELSAETLKLRGVRGYVVDGGCRDTAFIRRLGFPVWHRYATPSDIVGYWLPEGFGEPIIIERVTIRAGDYILADDDGVVVLPKDRIREIVAETEEVMGRENRVRQAILAGMDPREAYLTYRKF
jgi:4-hydroxy-4-methyl-2-oxoglutarate aldolase